MVGDTVSISLGQNTRYAKGETPRGDHVLRVPLLPVDLLTVFASKSVYLIMFSMISKCLTWYYIQ